MSDHVETEENERIPSAPRQMLDELEHAVFELDEDLDLSYVNSYVERCLDTDRSTLVGTSLLDVAANYIAADGRDRLRRQVERVSTGATETTSFELPIDSASEPATSVTVRLHPVADDAAESSVFGIAEQSSFDDVLSEVNQWLVTAETTREMLPRATEIIASSDRSQCTFLGLSLHGETEYVCQSGSELTDPEVREFHTPEYFEYVYSEGHVLVDDVTTEPFEQHSSGVPSHAGVAIAVGHESHQYGVLTVHFPPKTTPTTAEIRRLQRVADNIGVFLRKRDLEEQRKRREQQLRHSRDTFEDVYSSIQDAVLVYDYTGEFLAVNSAATDELGYSEQEFLDMDLYDLAADEYEPSIAEWMDQLRSGETLHVETVYETKSGARRQMDVRTSFVRYFGQDAIMSVARDITDRKTREQQLEKRDKLFRELYRTTRECLDQSEDTEIHRVILRMFTTVLEYPRTAILRYVPETGTLAVSEDAGIAEECATAFPVEPGENPLWTVFETGETSTVPRSTVCRNTDDDTGDSDYLVVPIGDFGMVVTEIDGRESVDPLDVEMMELVTTNAEAILQRIQRTSELGDVTGEISEKESSLTQLQGLFETVNRINDRLAESETRAGIEAAACEELAASNAVDFAWIGVPDRRDTELTRSAWAGEGAGYLKDIDHRSLDDPCPAQQAADSRETVRISRISKRVNTSTWSKTALAHDLRSVISIPLIRNQVLHGVLSVYSSKQSGLDDHIEGLVETVASLLVSYIGIRNRQSARESRSRVELEFAIADHSYPLYSVAAETESVLQFEDVIETTDDVVKVLISVRSGEMESVVRAARDAPTVVDAEQFGSDSHLVIEVQTPFLGTEISQYGATLEGSTADEEQATVTVSVPIETPARPLIEWLQGSYQNIELLARRESMSSTADAELDPRASLTERQAEVLNAAYRGGYYDTPRSINGDELAENFDISNSAVYSHLRTAHRKLISQFLDIGSENDGVR